ncbi:MULTISPECIES: YeeE/YedE family protein [Arsenophonus]|uniref:YeeE/YedE family protein n=1 Tax=Arsenophonus TaxID=637 RepID=UPI0015D7F335|nr:MULTISPECIES: YeeE/YedE family protein [Arsenophonus]UBX28773.1 YeeE/YedE family protein [Arsenophonus apicola]
MISLSHISGLVLGGLLGFIMQRGRFCLAGGIRDFYLFRDGQMIIAILIVISIQSVGLFGLQSLELIILPYTQFLWLATIVGGILFGSGMALAGSCSTGAYYRTAEGLVGSIMAVIGFILSSWLVRLPISKSFFSPITSQVLDSGTITQTFHVSPCVIMPILTSLTIYLAIRHIRLWKPINIAKITAKKRGIGHLLFEARWHPFITAMLVGIIALLAWPASLSAGRIGGLGISGPSAQFFTLLIDGNFKFFNWAGYLLIGLLLGSFIAAKGSQEFRFRNPGWITLVKSFVGGLLMGIGSGLAGGCMLGNTLVNTAWFSWQGWVFIPCIIFGSWLISYFTVIRPWQIKPKRL